ncbi:precorrin-6A/cobalt-precorrin-6A reductase [Roseobacteraceae bacterium S113]
MVRDVLIIGGSAEGHRLARAVPGARAVVLERLRTDPGDVAYDVLTEAAVLEAVRDGQGPVVLASHPCDARLREDLARRCMQAHRPLLHLIRPPWTPEAKDRWHMLTRDADVGGVVPEGARVLVGIGRAVRALQAHLGGRYLVIRQLGARQQTYEGEGHYSDAPPPFTVDEEMAHLRAERIDWLMVRNAGGPGAWPKLAAARALGLPVAMLPRPADMAGVAQVSDVEGACAWIKAQR